MGRASGQAIGGVEDAVVVAFHLRLRMTRQCPFRFSSLCVVHRCTRTPSHCVSAFFRPAWPSTTTSNGAARPRCWRSVTTAPQVAAASEAARRSVSRHFWPVFRDTECRQHRDRHHAAGHAYLEMKAVQEHDRIALRRQVAILPAGEERFQPADDPRYGTFRKMALAEQRLQCGSDPPAVDAAQITARGSRHRSRGSVGHIGATAGCGTPSSRRPGRRHGRADGDGACPRPAS